MTKHFRIPKGYVPKKVYSDENGDVWMDNKKIWTHGKIKYKIESWFQNNEVIIAKMRKM
jgi:hypothetical protein